MSQARVLALAAQCGDADDAQIEGLMLVFRVAYPQLGEISAPAALRIIDRDMRIVHDRPEMYWWLPPAHRLDVSMSLSACLSLRMIFEHRARNCWRHVWDTSIRATTIRTIYDNIKREIIPKFVLDDMIEHADLATVSVETHFYIVMLTRNLAVLQAVLARDDRLAVLLWNHAASLQSIAILRECLPVLMTGYETSSYALRDMLVSGVSPLTNAAFRCLRQFLELWPAMAAAMIGAVANGLLKRVGETESAPARFFKMASALPSDLQLYLAQFLFSPRVIPSNRDIVLVAGAVLGVSFFAGGREERKRVLKKMSSAGAWPRDRARHRRVCKHTCRTLAHRTKWPCCSAPRC